MIESNMISAADELGYATDKVSFLTSMFGAASRGDLDFDERGMCGLCQILR